MMVLTARLSGGLRFSVAESRKSHASLEGEEENQRPQKNVSRV